MSHAATHWLATVQPDRMTHGEFRVMFHLCDCHNASMGCFPKQTYLRDHTGLSNGGLNKALGELERKGLIRREQERDARTNRQKPTRYILGFELDEAQEPTPLSGDGADSTIDAVPSPLSGGVRLHSGGAYIDEPVNEPVNEPCAAAPAHTDFDFPFSKFVEVYPRLGDLTLAQDAFDKAIADGASAVDIVAGAKAYAAEQKGNNRQYVAFAVNWLGKKRWLEHAPKQTTAATAEAIAEHQAKAIRSGRRYLTQQITPARARELVGLGLVTESECAACGVAT